MDNSNCRGRIMQIINLCTCSVALLVGVWPTVDAIDNHLQRKKKKVPAKLVASLPDPILPLPPPRRYIHTHTHIQTPPANNLLSAPAMALLGKRKSRDGETASADVSELDAAAIFRRHFEAQFAPLDDEDEAAARAQREQDDDDAVDSDLNGDDDGSDDEDAWGGFSSAEEEDGDGSDDDDDEVEETAAAAVQVIDHSKPQIPKEPKMSKKELKAFMASPHHARPL